MKSLIPTVWFLAGAAAVAAVDYLPGAHWPRSAPSLPKVKAVAAPQAACLAKGNCTCGDNCACTAQGECLNYKPSTAHWPDKVQKIETFPDGSKLTTTSTRIAHDTAPPPSAPGNGATAPAPAASPTPVSATVSGGSYLPAQIAPVQYTVAPGYRLVCPTDGSPCYQVPIQPAYQQPQGYWQTRTTYDRVQKPRYNRRGQFVGWEWFNRPRQYQVWVAYQSYQQTSYANCGPRG